jgi:GNAT superfamily N-acetyltransferase
MSEPHNIEPTRPEISPEIKVAYLADTAEMIPLVAAWQHAEWSNYAGARTLEERHERLQEHLERGTIPTTFMAWEGSQPVGIASLVANDLEELSEWIPWLASVFVLPERRGRGIGSLLVERVAAEATSLGYPRLYLFTPDKMSFYQRLGWHTSHQRAHRESNVTVMTRDLIVNPPALLSTSIVAPSSAR